MMKNRQKTKTLLAFCISILAFQTGCAAKEPATVQKTSQTGTTQSEDCRITGGKLVQPRTEDNAICSRFMAPIQAALPGDARVTARLTLRPGSRCEAQVTMMRPGRPARDVSVELAVMDRPLRLSDVEGLAAEVLAQLRATP